MNPNLQTPDREGTTEKPAELVSRKGRLIGWLTSGSIHDWVGTVTVIVAAVWGIYTFIYKDIWLPSRSPASLLVEVEQLDQKQPLAPNGQRRLNLRITAKNSTQRSLFLLQSVWWLWGIERQPANDGQFQQTAAEALESGGIQHAERGNQVKSTAILATGPLFVDNRIQPGETISRDLPVVLPASAPSADQLELSLIVPVLARDPSQGKGNQSLFSGSQMRWSYSDQRDVHPELCSTKQNNKTKQCKAVDQAELGRHLEQFDADALLFHKTTLVTEQA